MIKLQGLSDIVNFKLEGRDIQYRVEIPNPKSEECNCNIPGYNEILEKVKAQLSIKANGYNLYLIDNFSKYKMNSIINTIKDSLKGQSVCDICYLIMEEDKEPQSMILPRGKGLELKTTLEELQSYYMEVVFDFYHNSIRPKDEVVKDLQRKRNVIINKLFDIAKNEGFDVKSTTNGFTFVPLRDGDSMTERDYDNLDFTLKEDILNKVSDLKEEAHKALEEIKNSELEGLQRIKEIMLKYMVEETSSNKYKLFKDFTDEENAFDYLKFVCENIEKGLVDTYSSSYEEDEEKINEIIYKYSINVLVDNSKNEIPNVIFEDDPTISNLIGSIEYESHNGSYITDVSLMKAGSLLKAYGGCLIIRANSLFSNPATYYFLRKTLISGKLKFDYNKSYLELLTINSLRPRAMDIKVKVILIGDYETYDTLYNIDEDFKSIFKIRLEYDSIVERNETNNRLFIANLKSLIKENSLLSFDNDAFAEIFRYLSRKAESKKKYIYDDVEIDKILFTIDNFARGKRKSAVSAEDVVSSLYERDLIEKHMAESYKEARILFNTEDSSIGSVNGLSVIDMGYVSFGRPIRITCSCYKGEGHIVDVQKESNLSGNIHNKSINILKGLMNRLFGGYNSIPVDFHISFEQIYGKVEGDSASVAEIVAIISALSKMPVNQSIAVTGSINQFGEVQPVGGINEKIEGFYNVCRLKSDINNKGVLLPKSNIDNIVLKPEVEKSILKGEFSIYAMETLEDALTVLIGEGKHSAEDIMNAAQKELKKYTGRNKN